jgi:hypothetical protein
MSTKDLRLAPDGEQALNKGSTAGALFPTTRAAEKSPEVPLKILLAGLYMAQRPYGAPQAGPACDVGSQ